MAELPVILEGKTIALARQGVFRTINGEGHQSGLPQVFIRLAGCSVGCEKCDTDYRPFERVNVGELKHRVGQHVWGGLEWAWITGGEPTDHDVPLIVNAARECGLKVALATAGTREAKRGLCQLGGVDFLSVSPHGPAGRWVQRSGDQINLVPLLNGLSLEGGEMVEAIDSCWKNFNHRYVTPLADREGRADKRSLEACRRWVDTRHGWKLGAQAHKGWLLP
jgi:organic radical activating enzyme